MTPLLEAFVLVSWPDRATAVAKADLRSRVWPIIPHFRRVEQ